VAFERVDPIFDHDRRKVVANTAGKLCHLLPILLCDNAHKSVSFFSCVDAVFADPDAERVDVPPPATATTRKDACPISAYKTPRGGSLGRGARLPGAPRSTRIP